MVLGAFIAGASGQILPQVQLQVEFGLSPGKTLASSVGVIESEKIVSQSSDVAKWISLNEFTRVRCNGTWLSQEDGNVSKIILEKCLDY